MESCIYGSSCVVFGGRIILGISSTKSIDKPNIILNLNESNRKLEIGEINIDSSGLVDEKNKSKTMLIFDNPRSIDVLIENLECAKELLVEKINNKK
jgi:hypothetical protein